jgi:hypothetical protein
VADMSRYRVFMALVLSGLVVLSACSSATPAAPASGTSSVSASVRIGRYVQVFASPLPANPAQSRVVEGFREAQVLWGKSVIAWHLVPPVRAYVTGQALTHLIGAMNTGKVHDLVWAGMDRFFMTRVTAITGRSAMVATCDDGSKFTEENPRTGKVDASFLSSPQEQYLFETWRMVWLGGHWAITAYSVTSLPSRTAVPCQPGMSGVGASRAPDVAVLLRQTGAAIRAASSVHISGTVPQAGKTVGVNLAVTRSGALSGQISENGAAITVLATHGHTYLKLSAEFLKLSRLPAAVCTLFCGKYLEATTTQSQALLNGLSMGSLMDSITQFIASTPARPISYVGTGTVDGEPTWLLQDSYEDLVYVASHGKPYILRVVAAQPSAGTLSLTQWDAAPIPGPPPTSQVVKLSQLTG